MRTVSASLAAHPDLPVAIRLPGAALEHIRTTDLWAGLDRGRVRWLAGGFTDPILTALPPAWRRRQLEREAAVMDAAGIQASGLWVAGAWEPALVDLARDLGLDTIYLPDRMLEGRPTRPGAVERAGSVVIGVPVLSAPDDSNGATDGMTAVLVEPDHLEELADGDARGRLTDAPAYLEGHLPGPPLRPIVASPPIHPDREVFYRKLLLLASDLGERSTGLDDLLRLQSRELLEEGNSGGEVALVALHASLDTVRRRGESWAEVTEVDWDADGIEESRLETATTSLLVDPADAALVVWDDKPGRWPITGVQPARTGLLVRRLTVDDREPQPVPLRPVGRGEGKGVASVTLEAPDGTACRLVVRDSTLTVEITVVATDPLRVGPEIPVDLGPARVRADGGMWVEATAPVALTGHRFRLTDDRHTLVAASPRPCQLFVTPLHGGGALLWPHWLTSDGGTYRISLTPS